MVQQKKIRFCIPSTIFEMQKYVVCSCIYGWQGQVAVCFIRLNVLAIHCTPIVADCKRNAALYNFKWVQLELGACFLHVTCDRLFVCCFFPVCFSKWYLTVEQSRNSDSIALQKLMYCNYINVEYIWKLATNQMREEKKNTE